MTDVKGLVSAWVHNIVATEGLALRRVLKNNMGKITRIWTISAIAFLLYLSPACSDRNDPASTNVDTGSISEQPKRGGTITYRLASAPSTFNYLVANDEPSVVTAFYLLGARLVDFDHRSRTYVPSLAESWKVGPDGRTIDIKLREELKFSDGHSLTTEDVAFTLRAIYDERTNAAAFRDSLLIDGKPIDFQTIDSLNMRLVLPTKIASVETYLTNFAVLPSHVLKPHQVAGKLSGAWKIDTDPKSIITCGPFIVEASVPGVEVTLSRNPQYWKKDNSGTQLPYLDKLVLKVLEDPNSAAAALTRNEVDIIDRIRPTDFASLSQNAGNVIVKDLGPGMSTDYLWFNLNKSTKSGERLEDKPKFRWFSDKRFRRAIAHAVDRESIASVILKGLASPLYGFVSPASQGWMNPHIPRSNYDLGKARQLLSEAGFVLKDDTGAVELFDSAGNPVEFSLLLPAGNEPRMLMASVIQEDLARLGIKIQIAPIDMPSLSERWTRSFDYDAILLGLGVTDFEPSSYANFLLSSGATHQWQPLQKNPSSEWEGRTDQLFVLQAAESDPKKRAEIFNEIQAIFAEEVPIIPIVARHVTVAANLKVGNFDPSPIMPNSLWNADELFVKQ